MFFLPLIDVIYPQDLPVNASPIASVDALIDDVEELLSLPDAAIQLNTLLTDPDATTTQIADVVSLDPATFRDADVTDAHTATIDWGGGSAPESGEVVEAHGGSIGVSSGKGVGTVVTIRLPLVSEES